MCRVIEVCDLAVGLAGVRPGNEMNLSRGVDAATGRMAERGLYPACMCIDVCFLAFCRGREIGVHVWVEAQCSAWDLEMRSSA